MAAVGGHAMVLALVVVPQARVESTCKPWPCVRSPPAAQAQAHVRGHGQVQVRGHGHVQVRAHAHVPTSL